MFALDFCMIDGFWSVHSRLLSDFTQVDTVEAVTSG